MEGTGGTYRVFLDLGAFMAAARAAAAAVAVQPLTHVVGAETGFGRQSSALVLTAAPAGGALLGARIVVEETELGLEPAATRAAVQARSQEAEERLRAALRAEGLGVLAAPEMILGAGLLADLRSTRCTQRLWRLVCPQPYDATTWRLADVQEPAGAGAA